MSSYRILSSKLAAGPAGSIVTATELHGCNIAALVAGGHIAPATVAEPEPETETDPEETEE